jgi:hypothetical protein
MLHDLCLNLQFKPFAVTRHYLLLVLLYPCISSQGQTDIQKGLVACYAFSGNAEDGSGNNYHGELHGPAPTADRYGTPAHAYYFDGKDDYISLPASPFRNQNFTFSMWINVSTHPLDNTGTVISIGGPDGINNGVEVNNGDNYAEGELGFNFLGAVNTEKVFMVR